MHKEASLVFVSYSSKDKVIAEKLVHSLISNGVRVWYDKWEILVGHDIVEKVYDGIKLADYLAIVLTANSIESQWVKEELNFAKIKEIEGRQTVVLPLVFDSVPIPPSLKTKRYADFTQSYEVGLEELLQVFGVQGSKGDMLFQLARVLEDYRNPDIRKIWDCFEEAFNRYPVPYIKGNTRANTEAFEQIKNKLDAGIKNTEMMMRYDHRALSMDNGRDEKHENALWRDTLWNRTWRIALEVSENNRELFIEDLNRFQETVAKEFRWRTLNEIGPSLANLWSSRARQVIENAIHVLYTIIDFKIESCDLEVK